MSSSGMFVLSVTIVTHEPENLATMACSWAIVSEGGSRPNTSLVPAEITTESGLRGRDLSA